MRRFVGCVRGVGIVSKPVASVLSGLVECDSELVPVASTAGFRAGDVVQFVSVGEDRRETVLVRSVIKHSALVVDRWEAAPGEFVAGSVVERVGRVDL